MRLSLRSPLRRLALAVILLVLAGTHIAFALRSYLAARAARSTERTGLELATRLEPGNATHHNLLGRYLALTGLDLEASIHEHRTAVALNPYKGRYWLDLALAYQIADQGQEQAAALERALRAEPTNPSVVWETANQYLVCGERDRGLDLLRNAVEHDPAVAVDAMDLAWRATGDVQQVLDRALPQQPPLYLAFLRMLVQRDQSEAAHVLWQRLVKLQQPFPATLALAYVNYLLNHGQPAQARQVWRDLAARDPSFAPYYDPENLIANGSFEGKLLGTGLDWRMRPPDGVVPSVDETRGSQGQRSLLFTFDGEHIRDTGLVVLIPVEPSTSYQFSAQVMGEQLQSVNLPRFYLYDPNAPDVHWLSEEIPGSATWQEVRGTIVTGPTTVVLAIRVVRNPYPGVIRGKLWIDDVRLVRSPSN